MKFIIDRKKWYRGKGSTESSLLRPDGLQCCVGQMCSQLGCNDGTLLDIPAMHMLKLNPIIFDTLGYDINNMSNWIDRAYGINDSMDISDTEREQKLTVLAQENGHELEFIN